MTTTLDPLHVLIVTPRYLPYTGGTETHVYEVGRRLVQAGVTVTVLTADPSRRLAPVEAVAGMRVMRVPSWPRREDYYFAPGVYRIITRGRWDLIHFQGCHTLVPPLGMLAARQAKIPYIVTFHGVGAHSSPIRKNLRGVQFGLLRPLLRRADQLVGVSHYEAGVFHKRLGIARERIAVIPNGIDIPYPPDPPEPHDGETLIASVGRLERFKGHHRVISALPRLVEQHPDVRLLVLGAGPYEPVLWRLAKRLGVTDRVEIRAIPGSDRVEMASQLMRASLVVLLSESESHPVAVLEALALQRPVLVADCAGLKELAERGFVRAISPRSTTEQVAVAILHQLNAPVVPTDMAIPSWDECTARLMETYQTIVWRSRCAS